MTRKNCHTWLLLFLLAAATLRAGAQENNTYITHTISRGQSLYSISNMYGVTVDDIVRLNPGSERTIYEGQQLRVPRPQSAASAGRTFHTIQAGETLYRLTVRYGVSAQDLCAANPGLSASNFRAGQVISIPQPKEQLAAPATSAPSGVQPPVQSRCREMHKVKRRETVFGIAQQYGIGTDELYAANPELKGDPKNLKRGAFLCIPYPKAQEKAAEQQREPSNDELFRQVRSNAAGENPGALRAAVILPFLPNRQGGSENERMVEYYQGLLLAVDSLKRIGTSIDLSAFDSGTTAADMTTLLAGHPEMKRMQLIIGPLHTEQIEPLAAFAQENKIRLVIPFTSRDNTVYNNSYVYQVNTPQSYLYSEVYDHFTRQFRRANVVFLEGNDKGTAAKAEFIKGLKERLQTLSVPMTAIKDSADAQQMRAVLKPDVPNIFIPTSGSEVTLTKALPQLNAMVNDTIHAEEVHLFGYPEWQTYTTDHLSHFFELDTYFYSSFYTNNLLRAPRQFITQFRRWYGKDMQDRYPKYGMLGFDTGFFFLKGLALYGDALEQNLDRMNLTPIQTGFKFERVNNWGGFINRKVFFVRFSNRFELIKLDFDQ